MKIYCLKFTKSGCTSRRFYNCRKINTKWLLHVNMTSRSKRSAGSSFPFRISCACFESINPSPNFFERIPCRVVCAGASTSPLPLNLVVSDFTSGFTEFLRGVELWVWLESASGWRRCCGGIWSGLRLCWCRAFKTSFGLSHSPHPFVTTNSCRVTSCCNFRFLSWEFFWSRRRLGTGWILVAPPTTDVMWLTFIG